MSNENCLICDRISMIKEDRNPYFVAELETGYVVIGDHQLFEGYTLFLCKKHITELHFLEKGYKEKYLKEMSIVSEAVYKSFLPDKLNYELLGNGDSHLHWHLFPRYRTDPVKGPVWWVEKDELFSDKWKPDKENLKLLKQKLYSELKEVTDKINKVGDL